MAPARADRKRPMSTDPTVTKKSKFVESIHQRLATSATPKKSLKATISSRERGRQYRARLRNHHKQLQRDVTQLRKQDRDLELLAELQQKLTKSPPRVANAVLAHVRSIISHAERMPVETDDPAQDSTRDEPPLRLRVATFALIGSTSAPVVVLRGYKQGKLPHELIHRLYFCTPGNSALLEALIDRELTFTTTRRLYFGADGSLASDVDETNYASVLAKIPGTACGLGEMVRELQQPGEKVSM